MRISTLCLTSTVPRRRRASRYGISPSSSPPSCRRGALPQCRRCTQADSAVSVAPFRRAACHSCHVRGRRYWGVITFMVTLSRPCGRGYPVSGDVRAGSRLRDLRDSSESCAHTVSPIMTGPNEYLSFDERDPARRDPGSDKCVTERRPTTRCRIARKIP